MKQFVCLTVVLAIAMVMAAPAYAQISTPCNASMINSVFSPCVNFLSNSSGNATSPTAECCNSIKSLTSGGMDCLCLIVTGNVPFTIPFNRTLAISLPRACKLPRLPVQCQKNSGSPLPAPGPVSFGPSLSPVSTPFLSPQGSSSVIPSPSLAPESDTSPPPSATRGSARTDLTPSSATMSSSYHLLPSLVFIALQFCS